jgi:hypothetical protein
MKLVRTLVVCSVFAFVPAAMGQKWEFGGGVGGGFYTSQDVTSPGGSASAKIGTNRAGNGWLGNNRQSRWGGELRYDFQRGDLQLSSGGTSAAFNAHTHALHYDILWHATPSGSKIRPFLAFGGGVKVYEGVGTETAYQPLSNIALLSRTQDITPLVSVGAGIKVQLGAHAQLRLDLHDYMTTFPKKVILPVTNGNVGSWINDFVPMIGISFTSAEGR